MRDIERTSPITFFFLVLPFGLGSGFTAVTLPFALTQAGVSVATAASIVALGLSAAIGLFLWGPLADLTLTPRHWYAIGTVSSAASLLLLGGMPLNDSPLLILVVFFSQVATTVVLPPIGGLMAHTVPDAEKGHAGGLYQAGIMTGSGIAGGAGVWLVDHVSFQMAATTLATAMLGCLATLYFVSAARGVTGETLSERFKEIAQDFRDMLGSPVTLVTIAVVLSPVGVGGAQRLWSAVAPGWNATADTVALATGALSAVTGALGCLIGGAVAVRYGRWYAYFGAGTLMVLVALVLAASPRTPEIYSIGVLLYAVTFGFANAAFAAIVLHAVGRGAAAAKFAIFWSIGAVPFVYATAIDGWLYEAGGATGMLIGEAALTSCCLALALWAIWKIEGGIIPVANRAKEPSSP